MRKDYPRLSVKAPRRYKRLWRSENREAIREYDRKWRKKRARKAKMSAKIAAPYEGAR